MQTISDREQAADSPSVWAHDPFTGRSVRIAPRRAIRPTDLGEGADPSVGAKPRRCPFCVGSEADTPTELDRVGDASGGWLARSVPNAFPACELPDGAHEVLIEAPEHLAHFAELSQPQVANALQLWAQRVAYWQADETTRYVLLFKNEGRAAGASLEHLHSQLVAMADIPPSIQAMWSAGVENLPDGSPLRPAKELVIYQDADWVVASPPAPRTPYEVSLAPRKSLRFSQLAEAPAERASLGKLLQRTIVAAAQAARADGYNLVLQLPPGDALQRAAAPWWIEIAPRTASMAGFELATGWGINAVTPLQAAEVLSRRLNGA